VCFIERYVYSDHVATPERSLLIDVHVFCMHSVTGVAQSLDSQYWKYSILRIKYQSFKKPINSERLAAKRVRIKEIQEELSVGLAHLRAASINVVDSLCKLRFANI
jgi:hypothetical protein